ncbi:MAG: hypothetical protein R3234_00135, partial [Thermoanaerobaculia bacterium]|nr:hypothetical protein [Thermoanaerobaculia bacterium]
MRDPRWPSALFPLVLALILSSVPAAEGQESGGTEVPEVPRTFSQPETAASEMDRTPGGDDPDALSPRNADYRIEVALDPETQILDGHQVLTWTNRTDTAADELRFHLYWNAWRNDRSTWMLEERLTGDRPEDLREEDWGWIEVDRIHLLGAGGAGE